MKHFFNLIFYLLGELFPGLADLLAEVLGDVEVVFLEDGRSAQRGILVSRIPPELFVGTGHQIILANIRDRISDMRPDQILNRIAFRMPVAEYDILPDAGY